MRESEREREIYGDGMMLTVWLLWSGRLLLPTQLTDQTSFSHALTALQQQWNHRTSHNNAPNTYRQQLRFCDTRWQRCQKPSQTDAFTAWKGARGWIAAGLERAITKWNENDKMYKYATHWSLTLFFFLLHFQMQMQHLRDALASRLEERGCHHHHHRARPPTLPVIAWWGQ